jgi:hypothetical protein
MMTQSPGPNIAEHIREGKTLAQVATMLPKSLRKTTVGWKLDAIKPFLIQNLWLLLIPKENGLGFSVLV